MTDPHDPLQGLDPFPRARIDGLHRERAELLEEIVSTPGPGKQPATTRAKVFLAGGIAAALAIVGGGVWAVTSADRDSDEGPVTAASSIPSPSATTDASPTDTATDPTPEPSEEPSTVPLSQVRKGDVLPPRQCRRADRILSIRDLGARPRSARRHTLLQLDDALTRLSRLRQLGRLAEIRFYVHRRGGPVIVIDGSCKVVSVSARGDDWRDVIVVPPMPSRR